MIETLHNTIVQGDCIEVMKQLDAGSVGFILTDPPYLVNYTSRDGRGVPNDDNSRWLRPAFREMYRVLAPDSFCVSFYGWNKVGLFSWAWRSAGFRLVGHLVFVKPYSSSTGVVKYQHEQAYVLAKGELCPHAATSAGSRSTRGHRFVHGSKILLKSNMS